MMDDFRIHACTDVTGFGLLGHLKEMTTASGVDAEIFSTDVPFLDQVEDLVMTGVIPGGTENNFSYLTDWIDWEGDITNTLKMILCDAQTSGGLLISVHPDDAGLLLEKLHGAKIPAARIIGQMSKKGAGKIKVN